MVNRVEMGGAPTRAHLATTLAPPRGAVQAGVVAALLFQVCTLVDGYFDGQTLPDQVREKEKGRGGGD